MSREWKPGDVVAVHDHPIVFFKRSKDGETCWTNEHGYIYEAKHISRDARPLVVIDPEDREQVQRFAIELKAASIEHDSDGAYFTNIARDALRSLITPPKPEEPTGLGAVVEDAEGRRYVYAPDGPSDGDPWTCADHDGSGFFSWDQIAAVKVLSEGVVA